MTKKEKYIYIYINKVYETHNLDGGSLKKLMTTVKHH